MSLIVGAPVTAQDEQGPLLAPLACTSCGAAVPLGDGASVRCPFCATDVAIPEKYVHLRDDAKTRIGDRAELDRLFSEVRRPPSKVMKKLADMGPYFVRGGLIIGALVVLMTVVGVLVREDDLMTAAISAVIMIPLAVPAFLETMFHALCARSYDLYDGLGPFAGAVPGIAVWLLIAAPIQISASCQGATSKIFRMWFQMRAGKPVQPGGPATCRGCGAPLDVPPAAIGVRCLYCRTDNLVDVGEGSAAADHKGAKEFHEEVGAVLVDHTTKLAAERKALRRGLVISLFGLMVGFGVLYFPAHWFLDHSFTMTKRAASYRGVLYPAEDGNPTIASNTPQQVELTFPYRCHEQPERRCIEFYVALRKGDRVTFETPGRTDLTFALQRHKHLVLAVGEYDPWVTDASLAGRARYTGWYRVEVTCPLATATAATTLRWFATPE